MSDEDTGGCEEVLGRSGCGRGDRVAVIGWGRLRRKVAKNAGILQFVKILTN